MPDKRRILFVDDEDRVLAGLQRMLRSMRNEWEMSFVGGGQEALSAMEEKSYDVVVSDMLMPGMSGAELLKTVRDRFPKTVRIALSGQTNKDMIFQSAEATHQFLSKPCSTETLKSTLIRACALRDLLTTEKLLGLISQLDSLPSLPSHYTSLVKELESPNASIKSIERIISRDIGMSAKVLQMVNSAFFGLRQHISSPAQAVVLLGLETIKGLALSVNVFSRFDDVDIGGMSLDALWNHCYVVGSFSKIITLQENCEKKIADDAFIAGLVHDVGKLALASQLPEEYSAVKGLVDKEKKKVYEVEREIFGTTHAQVGAYLVGLWGFSDSIVEALNYHHEPLLSSTRELNVLTSVHAANALTHEDNPDNKDNSLLFVDSSYLAEIGAEERFHKWREVCLKKNQRESNNE